MTPTLRRHTIAVNGIRMHVAEAGEGAPVVLLHGYPETWHAWRKQWPDLARDYHVIMPDLRGYGDTDKPDCHSARLGDSITSSTRMRFSVLCARLGFRYTQANAIRTQNGTIAAWVMFFEGVDPIW